MLQNLLATNKYLESALYAALGFLTVFIGIAFLIFVVWAAGKILTRKCIHKKETEKVNISTKQDDISMIPKTEEISEETLAIIMAALMAYYQTERPKCEFTVRRIKRI